MQYFSEFPPWLTKGRPAFLECGTVPTSLPNSNWPESCRYELGAWICRLVRLDLDRTWALASTLHVATKGITRPEFPQMLD